MEENVAKRETKKTKKRDRGNKLRREITLHSEGIKKENRARFGRKHKKNSLEIYRITANTS